MEQVMYSLKERSYLSLFVAHTEHGDGYGHLISRCWCSNMQHGLGAEEQGAVPRSPGAVG